ncbi:TPA: ABC transporter substrate-binding protein [Candidatus Bipolaricaulota bacterium]|nr:ABC transporter substrate-binding protein [Candidatus Bipolaricaulota bacterium]HIP99872.1 ABC transporter substrate-binding protein [Candidatus Bipolaricaulota bacterium]
MMVLSRKWLLVAMAVLVFGALALSQVTIEFWHAMSRRHGPILETLIERFMEENPDITVNLVYQGRYGALSQKLIGAVAAGEPPTIAQQYENWTTQWLDALVPLEDYLAPEVLADLHPRFREMNTFGGKLLTVPFNKSIVVLYYRPDLVPEPPTTWEEFLQLACELTVDENGDGVPERYGTGLRPPNPEIFLTFLAQNEGTILSEDWTEVTINDERGLETMEFMAQLAKCALVQGGYLSDPFGQGLIAMFVDTSAGYPYNLAAAQEGGFEMRVAKVPCHKNCSSMVQGTNLGVFELGQTPEQIAAAVKLIEFLLRPENTVYWAEESGYLPVTVSGFESEEWQAFIAEHPERGVMTEQFLEGGFGQLLHPAYWDIRSLILTYYEAVLLGEMEPKEALDALAAEIEALITE